MTIKDFARLCGCNPQTLRYYDRVNLLKPVQVDSWSGYRFYEKGQALTFVKIKNLQRAGFTIGEIKKLLDQDHDAICEALEAKIAQQKERLRGLEEIRKSYQSEMNQMKQRLQEIRERIARAMREYDPAEEFGIDASLYDGIAKRTDDLMSGAIARADDGDMELAMREEESGEPDFLRDPEYALVYEKHGWQHVKDFLGEFAAIEDGGEYALCFELEGKKGNHTAFANTVLGMLLEQNPGKRKTLGCTVHVSQDEKNHFRLLKRREA